jgi:hypothetical protein
VVLAIASLLSTPAVLASVFVSLVVGGGLGGLVAARLAVGETPE